jgi:V/A-type H+-transporting ATPase subunit G/H
LNGFEIFKGECLSRGDIRDAILSCPLRNVPMSSAHDEIDQIHETESAARARIEKAEKRARKIHEDADEEAKMVVETAEREAKNAATKMLSDIESKKAEIESSVFKETEIKIKQMQSSAKKKRDDAYQLVVKMLLGEV